MSASASIKFHSSEITSAIYINIVRKLIDCGWSINDYGKITYMADEFDWYDSELSELEPVIQKIAIEIDHGRASGLTLLWMDSEIGGSFLWVNEREVLFSLIVNPLKLKESNVVDFSWYLEKLVPVLAEIYVSKISLDHVF